MVKITFGACGEEKSYEKDVISFDSIFYMS